MFSVRAGAAPENSGMTMFWGNSGAKKYIGTYILIATLLFAEIYRKQGGWAQNISSCVVPRIQAALSISPPQKRQTKGRQAFPRYVTLA